MAAALAVVATLAASAVTTPFTGVQWDSLITAAAVVHATGMMTVAARRLPADERRPWNYAVLALAAAAVQLLASNLPELGVLSVVNGVLFLPSALGALACCWALGRGTGGRRPARVTVGRVNMDAVYVIASVFTLCYALVVEPVVTTRSLPIGETLVVLGYCLYAAIAIGYAAVVTTLVGRRLRPASVALLCATVSSAISACSFALVEVHDPRTWLTVSNVALLIGAYLSAVAVGLAGRPAGPPAPADRADVLTGSGLAALRLIRVTLMAPIVALASTLFRGTPISPTLTVLCCVLFLLIAAGIGVFIHQIAVLTVQLGRTKDHFRGLVESSSDVLTVLDDELRIVFASPAAGSVLGMEPSKLVGLRLPDLVGPADRDGLTRSLSTGALAAHVFLTQDDDTRELEVVAEGRRESGLIVRLRDVTDRRQHERALERMAYTDQLTGLPNRAAFFAAVSRWIGEFGADGRTSLMVLDLDGFKAVNDTAGHEAGDQLLVEVGRRLRRVVRDEDVVARLGGDEFALLVRGTAAEVDDVARRLVASVSLPHATGVGTFAMGASIGVTTLGSGGGHVAFREADTALRSAKELGKGIARRFTAHTLRESHRTATLAAELGDALRSGAMQVRYRPTTAPASGRVTMLEATPTWPHESLGEIGEAELRALCARNSLSYELHDWLVLQAAREVGSVLRSGADVRLALSVPADHRLAGRHAAATDWLGELAATGVRPEHLLLLVTEEALRTSASGLVEALDEAHQRGVQLCVADYGLGHTMIAHRSVLPFDMVRLDLRVMGGDGAERVALAARSAVAVSEVFGMQTLLDGVVTAEQYALACDLDVAGISGSFVHAAVTAGELPALFELPAALLGADPVGAGLMADLDGPGDGPVAVELSPGLTP